MHYDLDLSIDLKKHILKGTVVHKFRFTSSNVKRIVLDTRDITIYKVYNKDDPNKIYDYKIYPFNYITDMTNQQLVINLGSSFSYGNELNMTIEYEADKGATAVNWVTPEQTFGGKHEFMYTQCEAIQCRSIIPIQDSPSVKSTFDVKLNISEAYKAIASAVYVSNETKDGFTTYSYSQKIPVPSYLFALVAGKIESKDIGKRCSVHAEPEILKNATKELSEMDDFLDTIETVLTPYVWGNYSVVIMPPSFPYGGMENPYLTFVSPSIIIGDKSSANVVAHEICHSWFGNQITGKNWSHFWLNEGFTVYSERLITLRMHGLDNFTSQARIGRDDLEALVKSMDDKEFTKLFPNVYRKGPDGIMTNVAYEKGFLFLHYLEDEIGTENFYGFLRAYLASYSFKAIEVWDMKRAFELYVTGLPRESLSADPKDILSAIDWNTWILGTGIPAKAKKYTNDRIEAAIELAKFYIKNNGSPDPNPYKDFGLDLRIIFMRQLLIEKDNLDTQKIKRIDSDNNITETEKNPEVNTLWYRMAIWKKHEKVDKYVEVFLGSIGRQKYIVELYRAYVTANRKEDIKRIYKQLRNRYHPIAQRAIDKILA